VGIAFKVGSSHKTWVFPCLSQSPMDYFSMNLHAGIATRLWSSFKSAPKLHIGYFKMTLHVGITFKVAFSLQVLPKSPMGYFEMNLNMAIAFKVKISYNLQYPHMYLLLPITNLALIFLIIK
jgi:hypothetical protein